MYVITLGHTRSHLTHPEPLPRVVKLVEQQVGVRAGGCRAPCGCSSQLFPDLGGIHKQGQVRLVAPQGVLQQWQQ